MSAMLKNLLTRVTVSAIIGALVAAGIIYLSDGGVSKALQNDLDTHVAAQTSVNTVMQENLQTLLTNSETLLNEMKQEAIAVDAMLTAQSNEIEALQETISALRDDLTAVHPATLDTDPVDSE